MKIALNFWKKNHIFQKKNSLIISSRVVESESVESHVFSWSRSRVSKLLESESVFKTAGVGVSFQNCWSRSQFSKLLESESVFKTAGVGVGSRFSKLLSRVGSRFFKTAGVGVRSRNICCNYRLQCSLNNLNYNINCLKIITG